MSSLVASSQSLIVVDEPSEFKVHQGSDCNSSEALLPLRRMEVRFLPFASDAPADTAHPSLCGMSMGVLQDYLIGDLDSEYYSGDLGYAPVSVASSPEASARLRVPTLSSDGL